MKIQRGFTLIELLIAIAIFSAISMTGYQLLQGTVRTQRVTQEQTHQLAELTRLFALLEQDLLHALIMPAAVVRKQSAFRAGEDDIVLQLTRRNWLNPLSEHRSSLQHVLWRAENHSLIRMNVEANSALRFSGIEHVEMRFYTAGKWQTKWSSHYSLPQAIDITITTTQWGPVKRVFRLNNT